MFSAVPVSRSGDLGRREKKKGKEGKREGEKKRWRKEGERERRD